MAKDKDKSKETASPGKKRPVIMAVIGLLVVAAAGFGVYKFITSPSDDDSLKKTTKYPKTAEIEKARGALIDEQLKEGDIDEYQLTLVDYNTQYLVERDYKGSEAILKKLEDNVPASKMLVISLQALTDNAKRKNDPVKYKLYAPPLIEKLKQQGRTTEAETISKQLAAMGG